tara:strand:- start:151 stop:984 length:834 start_codon:yes stop_codon:yes gene_type:complete
MKNIYNIFRLNIKLFILSAVSLIFPQSRSLQVGKSTIKTLLMHAFMSKKYTKSKKINYKDLFYYRSPMPSQSFFEKQYKEEYSYYKIRGSPQIVKGREINQLDCILNSKKNFDFKTKEILNFGAGGGGFSILTSLLGAHVTEIDVTNFGTKCFDRNITRFNDLSDVQDKKFDLIYASHILEHVTDISSVLQMLKKISHDNTFYYFEVPNGKLDLEKDNVFHTYYFFKEFFEKIFFQRKNRSDHFLNIVYRERDSKIVDKESDDLVTWTNHSLNTDFL